MDDAPQERATLREVYRLVGEVRDDLGDRLDELKDAVNLGVLSHEHRITVVEQQTATHAEQLLALTERVDRHGVDIAASQEEIRVEKARTDALTSWRAEARAGSRWRIGNAVAVFALIISALTVIVLVAQ